MKKSALVLYLFEDEKKTDLLKIMEFRTIKELSYVLDMDSQIISNMFHGLIKPRGIMKNCSLYRKIPLV